MSAVGRLVVSVAGHDKGSVLCVVAEAGGYLLLADGKHRRVQSPKRKKQKHVVFFEDAAVFGGPMTNRAIKAFIRESGACSVEAVTD